ncbi:uncharacterized protein JCM15063_006078 [Sporobolomyces koalae]|uniref:uncharacterized protein n=1 Tax=Sporobolomyces koalae TaxID=500713 RepID=UPI003182B851
MCSSPTLNLGLVEDEVNVAQFGSATHALYGFPILIISLIKLTFRREEVLPSKRNETRPRKPCSRTGKHLAATVGMPSLSPDDDHCRVFVIVSLWADEKKKGMNDLKKFRRGQMKALKDVKEFLKARSEFAAGLAHSNTSRDVLAYDPQFQVLAIDLHAAYIRHADLATRWLLTALPIELVASILLSAVGPETHAIAIAASNGASTLFDEIQRLPPATADMRHSALYIWPGMPRPIDGPLPLDDSPAAESCGYSVDPGKPVLYAGIAEHGANFESARESLFDKIGRVAKTGGKKAGRIRCSPNARRPTPAFFPPVFATLPILSNRDSRAVSKSAPGSDTRVQHRFVGIDAVAARFCSWCVDKGKRAVGWARYPGPDVERRVAHVGGNRNELLNPVEQGGVALDCCQGDRERLRTYGRQEDRGDKLGWECSEEPQGGEVSMTEIRSVNVDSEDSVLQLVRVDVPGFVGYFDTMALASNC